MATKAVTRFGWLERLLPTAQVVSREELRDGDRAALWWLVSGVVWLTIVDLFGLIIATELVAPQTFAGIEFLTFPRMRILHVNGVIFAWLSAMYWGAIFFMLPRLLGRGLYSPKLARFSAVLWNLMFIGAILTVAFLGWNQGREYGELVWWLDLMLVVSWLINVYLVIATVLTRRVRPLYVTVWWAVASPLWLAADYIIGNVMWRPQGYAGDPVQNLLTGTGGSGAAPTWIADGMLNWWYAHNLFGLWLTPMLLAVLYYLVPRITNTPLYSHTLSFISFWGMAFFYTGVGHHHILQAPIPGWLKTYATLSSVMLLVPVFTFVTDIVLTMRGHWGKFFTNMPLRYAMTALIFYLLVNIQGSFEAIQQFNRFTHFTNFVVAHAHLALLGAFTFVGMGFMEYAFSRIYGKPIYSRTLSEWTYWLILVGFSGFFWSLTIAGFIQGQGFLQGIPEINLIAWQRPWYIARAAFGAMIVLAGIVQMYNLWQTVRQDTRALALREFEQVAQSGAGPRPTQEGSHA